MPGNGALVTAITTLESNNTGIINDCHKTRYAAAVKVSVPYALGKS